MNASTESIRTMNKQDTMKSDPVFSWMIRNAELAASLASGVIIIAAWILQGHAALLSTFLFALAYIVGGFVKGREGLMTLWEERDLDVNLLMIVAAIGAASIGYWLEGAALIFIFSFSGALETYTMQRSHKDISSLMEMKPETAVLIENGLEREVRIEELRIGDQVVVKPGERLPADGVIVHGTSSINQASITGESIPVDKYIGDEVFAGTLNVQGGIMVEVTKSSESTLFAKIIKLVQEAQSEMPATHLFIEKFERIYARIIVLATVLMIVVPPTIMSWTWRDALYRAMVFMVVASPCALVASIMPAVLSAISNGARQGLLFKGGAHLEHIAHAKVIAFDKTGTLTEGKPEVTDVVAFHSYTEQDILRIAASLECMSEHPLAEAIVKKAQSVDVSFERPSELHAVTGSGISAKFREEHWKIGKPSFIQGEWLLDEMVEKLETLEESGKTVVVIQNESQVVGMIGLMDKIRAETRHTVERLHRLGLKVAMLTGDQKITADAIAQEAGIDHVFSELLPEDKVNIVKQLKSEYGHVVMVGDGVNDAPALAVASVGIAMGATGSDAALETADLVLMNDEVELIGAAISLGKRTKRITRQNIVFAVTVIAALVTANFVQGVYLPFGVVGHEGSTILVILNGLRLLR